MWGVGEGGVKEQSKDFGLSSWVNCGAIHFTVVWGSLGEEQMS